MLKRNKENKPLRVGGEGMIQLLRGVRMDTLEQIADDLKPATFATVDLIRVIDRVIASRKQIHSLEEGDTISMEPEN